MRKRKSKSVINDDDKVNNDIGNDDRENCYVNNDYNNEEIENYDEEVDDNDFNNKDVDNIVDDNICITEDQKLSLKNSFKDLANIRNEYLSLYKQRLDILQKCILEVGFNYEQAKIANNLYLIWLSTQSFKSFEYYLIEVHKNKKSPNTKFTELYM